MWRRHLNILPSFIFKYVCIINNFFPGYEKYEFPPIASFDKQLTVRNKPNTIAKRQQYMRSLKKDSIDNIIIFTKPELWSSIKNKFLQKFYTNSYSPYVSFFNHRFNYYIRA